MLEKGLTIQQFVNNKNFVDSLPYYSWLKRYEYKGELYTVEQIEEMFPVRKPLIKKNYKGENADKSKTYLGV